MTHLITFVFCLIGFVALALATERQQEVVRGQALDSKTTRTLRVAGWAALVIALIVAVRGWGWAYGLVVYSGHTSLCAGVIFLGLVVVGQRSKTHRQAR